LPESGYFVDMQEVLYNFLISLEFCFTGVSLFTDMELKILSHWKGGFLQLAETVLGCWTLFDDIIQLPNHENGTVVFTASLFKLHSIDSLYLIWFLWDLALKIKVFVMLCFVM